MGIETKAAEEFKTIYKEEFGEKLADQEAMEKATKLELTEISQDFEGDIFFPEFERSSWDLNQGGLQDHEGIKYRFNTYIKK